MTSLNDPQTYAIIGAAMAVHANLGCGFLESVYQEALSLELESRGIPSEREVPVRVRYRNTVLRASYRADFVCYEQVVLELKALASISSVEQAQMIHYLKATGLRRGLILNFGGGAYSSSGSCSRPASSIRRFPHECHIRRSRSRAVTDEPPSADYADFADGPVPISAHLPALHDHLHRIGRAACHCRYSLASIPWRISSFWNPCRSMPASCAARVTFPSVRWSSASR